MSVVLVSWLFVFAFAGLVFYTLLKMRFSKRKVKTLSGLASGFLLSLAVAGVITFATAIGIISNLP
jgi:hypothetical protein